MDENAISRLVLDSAMKVHTTLGCGLLESTYETCLAYELKERSLEVKKQVVMPVRYGDATLDIGYRLDLLVSDKVVIEVKAVEKILALHRAQLLTYLKLGGYRLGILLNFNTAHLRNGITRVIN